MRDNEQAEEEEDDPAAHFAPEQNRHFQDDGRSGAMVEQAKRLMNEDDDEG